MPPFSETWIAFSREAAIASQSLSAGLASLRRANYAQQGLYSHAFFTLAIGFERILKLIFILNYAVTNNGQYPDEASLRNKFGHDIEKLFAHARSVHERLPSPHTRFYFPPSGIQDRIIHFISQFARKTRYYNLDYLVQSPTSSAFSDPIEYWYTKIGAEILQKHYSKKQQSRDRRSAAAVEEMMGSMVLVRHTAEDGSPITNVEEAALRTSQNSVVQKYGTFYCVTVARFLYMILCDLVDEAQRMHLDVPYLSEFFYPFLNEDSFLKSRKTFPPPGQ